MFREERLIARTAMAVALGIGGERLATYEGARVPLPYGVFELLWEKFSFHPQLLATGTRPPVISALPYESFSGLADKRALFSAVYEEKIKPMLTQDDPDKADRCWSLDRVIASYEKALRAGRISTAEANWVIGMTGDLLADVGEIASSVRPTQSTPAAK